MAKQVRRLNKRFVMFLTIGIMLVLTVAIAVLIMATRHKDPQMYADRADSCMASGDYLKAASNYMKAYKYSQKDPAWLIKAGAAQYEHGDIKYALSAIQTALTANPDLIPARKKLVEMYWELWGRNADPSMAKTIQDDADKLVKLISEDMAESDPELKKTLALGYHVRGVMRGKRVAEDAGLEALAREDLEKAISLDADPVYVQSLAMMSLADAQQTLRLVSSSTSSPEAFDVYIEKMSNSIVEAEKVYLSLVEKASDNSSAFVTLGDFYFKIWGRLNRSIAELCKIQSVRVQNTIFQLNRQLKQLNASKNVAVDQRRRNAKRLSNEIGRQQAEMPEWSSRQKKFLDKAALCDTRGFDFYKQALSLAKNSDDKVSAQLALANYYVNDNKLSEAESLILSAIDEDPKGYQAYRLFALIKKQEAAKAEGEERDALIADAIAKLNHRINEVEHDLGGVSGRANQYQRSDLIAILIEFYLDRQQEGDLAKADAMFKELEVGGESNPVVYQLKATRAIADKDYTAAIMLLETADNLSRGNNPSVKFVLAELYSRTGNLGAAKRVIDEGMKLKPGIYSALKLAMTINFRLGDLEASLRYANDILRQPNHVNDQSALATKLECLARLDRMDEADVVAKELQIAGVDLNWDLQKSRFLLSQGKNDEAQALLESAFAKDSSDKNVGGYLIEVYSRLNKMGKARELLDSLLQQYPDDEGLLKLNELVNISDPQARMARIQEMSQQMQEQAESKVLAAAESEEDPFKKAVKLFDYYAKREEMGKAKEYLDEAVKLDSSKANILNFRYAIIQGDWARAQKCVDLAKTQNLDSVNGLLYEAEMSNARGWDELSREKVDEAKVYFEKSATSAGDVIRLLPNDSQARALLGEAYWWLDRHSEAEVQIAKAIELNPNNAYALRASCLKLWDVLTAGGGMSDREVLSLFSSRLSEAYSKMPWNFWLKDKSEWFRRNLDKQREFLADETGDAAAVVARREELRKSNPGDIENLMRLAYVYENRSEVLDLDKAQGCYQQGLEENTSSQLVQQYLAFATRHQRTDGLVSFLKNLADRKGKSGEGSGYTALAYYYMMVRDQVSAEKAFSEAVKVEDSAAKRLDMAIFYRQIGDIEKSTEWCRKTLEMKTDAKQDKKIRAMMIESLLSVRKWDQAGEYIDQYKKLYPKEPQGQLYEARLVLEQGKLSEVEGILTQLLSNNPDFVDALDLRSMVYLYTWQLDKAKVDLEKIKELNPSGFGIQGQIRLAKLYCEMDKTVEAERETRALIESVKGQSGDSVEFIRQSLLPSLASALSSKAYKDLLTWASNMYEGYWGWSFERGQYEMMMGEYRQAINSYAKVWESVSDAPVRLKTMVLSAYLDSMYKAKSYAKLSSFASEALASEEFLENSSLITGWIATVYYAKGDSTSGYRELLGVLSAEKNPLVVWQIVRRMLLDSVKGSNLTDLRQKLENHDSKEQRNIKLALACVYFASEQFDKGEALYRELSASGLNVKEQALYLFLLGQEYTEAKVYPKAAAAFKDAMMGQNDNLVVMNNLAYILEEYLGKVEEAKVIIEPAYDQAPNNADLLDTYGQILVKLDRQEEGLYNTAKSVWVRESATSRYHLALILLAQHRRSDADIQFRRALQLVGEDKELEQKIREALRL